MAANSRFSAGNAEFLTFKDGLNFTSAPVVIARFSSWIRGEIRGVAGLGMGFFILDMGEQAFAAVHEDRQDFICCSPSVAQAMCGALTRTNTQRLEAVSSLQNTLAFWREFDGAHTFDQIQHPVLAGARRILADQPS